MAVAWTYYPPPEGGPVLVKLAGAWQEAGLLDLAVHRTPVWFGDGSFSWYRAELEYYTSTDYRLGWVWSEADEGRDLPGSMTVLILRRPPPYYPRLAYRRAFILETRVETWMRDAYVGILAHSDGAPVHLDPPPEWGAIPERPYDQALLGMALDDMMDRGLDETPYREALKLVTS